MSNGKSEKIYGETFYLMVNILLLVYRMVIAVEKQLTLFVLYFLGAKTTEDQQIFTIINSDSDQ